MSPPDRPPADLRARAALVAVVAGAFALRMGVPAGPAALRSVMEQAPAWITDPMVHTANAAIGAATCGAVYALARRLDRSTGAAVLAAGVLAVSPAHVRFSHTDSLAVPMVALLVAGLALFARRGSAAGRVAAGLCLGAAAALRPEGLWALPLALGVRWSTEDGFEAADGWAAVGLLGLVPALRFADPAVAPDFVRPLAWAPPWTAASVFLAMLAAGIASGVPGRIRGFALGWVGLTTVGACVDPGALLVAVEAQLVCLPGQALAAGIGGAWVFRALLRRRPVAAGVVGLVSAGLLLPPAWNAVWPTTLQQEYAFVAKQLHHVEPGCTILARLQTEGTPTGPVPPVRLSHQLGLDHTWVDLEQADQPYDTCQLWFRGANCYAQTTPAGPADTPSDLPLGEACATLEDGLEPTPFTLAHAGAVRHSTDHYPANGRMQLGFYEVAVPVDPSVPVPSKPPAPRSSERTAREREALATRIAELPPWTAPRGWSEEALRAVLEQDLCPADAIQCSSDLCVAISTDPACDRGVWHARTNRALGQPVSRLTWAETSEGFTAVAVALVPDSARADPSVVARVDATARLLLKEALYE